MKTMCPNCRKETENDVRLINPPFTSPEKAPLDFVLIPSKGKFDTMYKNSNEGFHIGVTTRCGDIISFESHGIKVYEKSDSKWMRCLPLKFRRRLVSHESAYNSHPTIQEQSKSIELAFEEIVSSVISIQTGTYHESRNNCLDFILKIVRLLMNRLSQPVEQEQVHVSISSMLSEVATDKEKFCSIIICDSLKSAMNYVKTECVCILDQKSSYQ